MTDRHPEDVEKLTQGRRWKPVLWLAWVEGPSGHHLTGGPDNEASQLAFDPDYEYRVIFDPAVDLWRLDARRHAAGG